jgi:hypothetical protein
LRISGGCAPAGSVRRRVWEMAVTWALACARLACGCRKIFVIERPLMVVDSRCSILSTGGREGAFVDGRKPAFHLLRIHASILPSDGDHRDINMRKRL